MEPQAGAGLDSDPPLAGPRVHAGGCSFTNLKTHRVEAEIEPENVRSARLPQRLGFQREGLLRDRLFVPDRPRTQQMYGLLRSEWGG